MALKLFNNGTGLFVSSTLVTALAAEQKVASATIGAAAAATTIAPPPPPTPVDVAKDSALGKVRATSAVGKRLEVSPALEFVNIARATKQRFFIGGLDILARTGFALEDIPVTGFEVDETPAPVPGQPAPELVRKPIEDAAHLLRLYQADSSLRVVDDDDDTRLDVEEENEATFFSKGLNSIDSTVRFLRGVETRADEYRRLQDDATAARDRLKEAIERIRVEIGSVETRLAEVRHDLSVARALRAEEVQRVAQLIERRRTILNEHVPFLVFRRPRFTRVLDNTPVLPAEPALIDDPVPAARRQTDELLPELQQMVDTLRDLPARWFRKAAPLFERFDRAQSIERLADAAFERMELIAQKGRAIAFDADGSRAAQKLRKTFDSHEQRVLRIALSARDGFGKQSLGTARSALEAVRGFASIADLLRTAPATREVTLVAAGLLDDIGNVAHTLYEMFCEVPPATRLRWAELFSELDTDVSLRQLTILPDYGNEATGVDFIQWRQMQKLVDWLFLQVQAEDEAVAAINDLIQVCLLLSAHAPVKRILSARIKRPVPAAVDAKLELELDPRSARIGMQVLVHAPQTNLVIARAVVEDIAAGGGVARITQVMAAQTTIDTQARVQLQAGPALSTAAAAKADQAKADPARAQSTVRQQEREDLLAQRELRGAGGKMKAVMK